MTAKPKYPWLLSGVFLLIYLFTAAYPNSKPPLPGLLPFGLADAVLAPRFLILAFINTGLLVFLYFRIRKKKQSLAFCSIIVFLALSVLSYFAFISIATNAQEALFKAVYELQFLLFFLTLIYLLSDRPSPLLIMAKALLPLSLLHFSILSFQYGFAVTQKGFDHSISYSLTALMGHRNLAAQISFLFIPFHIYLFLKTRQSFNRILLFLLIAGLFFFSVVSLSRAVWLATVIVILLTAFLLIIRIKHWANYSKKQLRLTGIIFILTLTLLGFSFGSSMPDTIKKQLHFIENPYYGSASERLKLWEFSLEEMKQHPMQGLGGNNWGIMAMKHDVSSVRPEMQQGTQVFFQRPHNDFIWKYCETGLWGLLAFVLVFLMAFFILIKKYLSSTDRAGSQVALTLLSLIIGFLIFSFFSFPDERPMLKLLFMAVLSLVVLHYGKSIFASHYSVFVLFPLQLLILPAAMLKLHSAKHNHLMQNARMNQNYQEVITQAEKAANYVCNLDDVATPFEYYAAEAFLLQGKQQKAERSLLDALHANPNHPYILKGLGQIKCDKKQYQLAKKYFSQALQNYPSFDLCRMQYAVCLKKMNNIYAAIDQMRMLKDSSWIKTSAPMLKRWLPAACWKTAQVIKNEEISKVLLRMEKNPKWLQSIYQKSRANNTDYRDQLIMDAIFLLKSEGIIDEDKALEFKEQHLRKAKMTKPHSKQLKK